MSEVEKKAAEVWLIWNGGSGFWPGPKGGGKWVPRDGPICFFTDREGAELVAWAINGIAAPAGEFPLPPLNTPPV